jgi:PadR family transcriptional regulator PadR
MYSNDLIRGTLRTIILKLLSEQDSMYGYEMTQLVRERTKDKIVITEGALYPLLHQLEAEGVVTTELVSIGKRVRKYYKLTKPGKKVAREKVSEFDEFLHTMQILLDLKPI